MTMPAAGSPKIFGMVLMQLTQAREVMRGNPRLPVNIWAELDTRREELLPKLSASLHVWLQQPASVWNYSYLLSIECSASTLLRNHNVLAISASVFGSTRTDCSILSTLSLK